MRFRSDNFKRLMYKYQLPRAQPVPPVSQNVAKAKTNVVYWPRLTTLVLACILANHAFPFSLPPSGTILFRILGMSTLASLHNCIHHDFTIKVFLTYAQYMYNHEAPLLFPSQRKHMMRTLRHDPENSTSLRFDPGIFVANRATSRNHLCVRDKVTSSAIIEAISRARMPKQEVQQLKIKFCNKR